MDHPDPITKRCRMCGIVKTASEFGKSVSCALGLRSRCKECRKVETAMASESRRAYYAQRYIEKREQIRAAAKAYRNSGRIDKERARISANARYKANPQRYLERNKRYRLCNKPKLVALNAKNYAAKRGAAPAYANAFFMEEAYYLAARRTAQTGIKWNVDHIVPLQSKIVCGLHVEYNLSVIPARVNVQKGNRRWPDMP